MCGICGEVRIRGATPPCPDDTRRMVTSMRHRGPDGEGIFHDDRAAIGSARLAIIDPDGVLHLNGIFAFAIWDQHRRVLFAARDRLGVKPFFYTVTEKRLIFASELKVMLAHPAIKRKVDLVSLSDYLTFGYVPTPRSMIEGVQKLPPGPTLTVERGRVTIEPYWDVRLERSETGRESEREYERELLDRLAESVRHEPVSDVPVGAGAGCR